MQKPTTTLFHLHTCPTLTAIPLAVSMESQPLESRHNNSDNDIDTTTKALFTKIEPSFLKTTTDREEAAFITAHAVQLSDPSQCAPLIKHLAACEDYSMSKVGLCHLKRVKKVVTEIDDNVDSTEAGKKRLRKDATLYVLLGPISAIDNPQRLLKDCENIITGSKLVQVEVPARLPTSQQEYEQFCSIWPTAFLPDKFTEHIEKQAELASRLSDKDLRLLTIGMQEAIIDAKKNNRAGAVVLCPILGKGVSTSNDELQKQNEHCKEPSLFDANPLVTPIILALQGVSRIEREALMDENTTGSGQYLCTGYTVCTTLEPTTYEAMALVHHRVARVVYGYTRESDNNHDAGLSQMHVHGLPGTNHKYTVYCCTAGTELANACKELHDCKNDSS